MALIDLLNTGLPFVQFVKSAISIKYGKAKHNKMRYVCVYIGYSLAEF